MRLRLWGVRGSVPWATPGSIGHGCNTPCLELVADDGHRLTIDAGSGLVGLGEGLPREPGNTSILLTHYHWDHIQGLPFFTPLYIAGSTPTIWAPETQALTAGWVETIFQSPFFPVPYEELPSRPHVEPVGIGSHVIEGFQIQSMRLNHPGGAFAYRIKGTQGDVVYATDHELGDAAIDERLTAFVAGAKLLILDAHFTPGEHRVFQHWGHSDWKECAEFAAATGVERLWLFHHKPGRTDIELIEIEAEARKIFPRTDAAGEGDTIEF